METGLGDKVAVVTGAGSGIGLATTRALVAEGAYVVAADIAPDAAASLERVLPIAVDLATADGPEAAVEAAVAEYDRIDVLVNNVGIAPLRDGFLSVDDTDWHALIELNFMSMVRTSRAAIRHMLDSGGGVIVSVASDSGHSPPPFMVDYAVTKNAIRVLSKALATEFARDGIRSNSVSPGPTRTPPWTDGDGVIDALAAEWGLDRETATERFVNEERRIPLGRLGEPEDVAAAIVFLASDRARQITGSDFRVDGGCIPTV
jgi:NAD(P)-dependent dehydrogenase (short-subunit alcohol dehydrogenase family)